MKYRPCGYLKIIVILQPFKYYYLCDGNITQMCLLILISANNLDSRVINGYFIKISNLNVPYIT